MSGTKKTGFVAGNARGAMIPSASSQSSKFFLRASFSPQTNMIADGWAGYRNSPKKFPHELGVLNNFKSAVEFLPLAYLQFNDLESWLNGTLSGVSPKHLSAYLHEWNYRFNRRYLISKLFPYVIKRVANIAAVTTKKSVGNRTNEIGSWAMRIGPTC